MPSPCPAAAERHRVVALLLLLTLGCTCGIADRAPLGDAAVVAVEPEDASVDAPYVIEEGRKGRIIAIEGVVQIRRGAEREWEAVELGEEIEPEDAIRTSELGTTTIELESVTVRLGEGSELRVEGIEPGKVRAKLRGAMSSTVPKGRELEVAAEQTDAKVRSTGGHFSMTADGRGVVAVAAIEDPVEISGDGETIVVAPGQTSRVRANQRPEKPSAALRKVLLAVRWPNETKTNRVVLPVAGQVEVGSRLWVQNRPVAVGARGDFRVNAKLADGKQDVEVRVTDVLGRTASTSHTVVVDTRKPKIKLERRPWQ